MKDNIFVTIKPARNNNTLYIVLASSIVSDLVIIVIVIFIYKYYKKKNNKNLYDEENPTNLNDFNLTPNHYEVDLPT
jgi:heme/copper-type cytochrome/quinol oxidase subunit 2